MLYFKSVYGEHCVWLEVHFIFSVRFFVSHTNTYKCINTVSLSRATSIQCPSSQYHQFTSPILILWKIFVNRRRCRSVCDCEWFLSVRFKSIASKPISFFYILFVSVEILIVVFVSVSAYVCIFEWCCGCSDGNSKTSNIKSERPKTKWFIIIDTRQTARRRREHK